MVNRGLDEGTESLQRIQPRTVKRRQAACRRKCTYIINDGPFPGFLLASLYTIDSFTLSINANSRKFLHFCQRQQLEVCSKSSGTGRLIMATRR